MNIKNYLSKQFEQVFEKLNFDTKFAKVTFSDRVDLAHFQCNGAFGLSKTLGKNPFEVANLIVDNLENLKDDFDFSVVGGFINIKIKDTFLNKVANDCLLKDDLNIEKINNPITLVIDYGGANVAKPLHIGHLRSAIIGEAIKRLNKFLGNTVIGDVHLGDWGLQMGLTIAQLMDDYNLGWYFGEDVIKQEITIDMLDDAYPKASLRKKEDEEFYKRSSDITLWLQNKKKGYYEIWQEIRKVSIECVRNSYEKLGVDFDLWNGESSVNDLVPEIVQTFKDNNLAHISEGALVVDVKEEGDKVEIPPALLVKHNGAQMYHITDIATIVDRFNKYSDLNKILYFTDSRQGLHFTQVFRSVRKANLIPDEIELSHVGFGTVNGTDGKPFKTRDGGVLKLDDLISMATNKAKEKLIENGTNFDEKLAWQIGMSAIIYGDLSNVISKDYVLDLDKFLTFEGKTGPYIQYTAVRIKSLIAKSNYKVGTINIQSEEEKNIVLNLLKLIDSFEISYRDNSLNSLALSLYELASSFSNLYNNIKILSIEDENRKNSILALGELTLKALTIGANILGIQIPDKM